MSFSDAAPVYMDSHVAFKADDRASLLVALGDEEERPIPYLVCRLPCGEQRIYQLAEDVPAETQECHCGRLSYRHYFIRYRGLSR